MHGGGVCKTIDSSLMLVKGRAAPLPALVEHARGLLEGLQGALYFLSRITENQLERKPKEEHWIKRQQNMSE